MINITKLIKQRYQYSTILEENSKLHIRPNDLDEITFSGECLIQKNVKLKKKQIILLTHHGLFQKKKFKSIESTQLLYLTSLNEIEGLKFVKSGTSMKYVIMYLNSMFTFVNTVFKEKFQKGTRSLQLFIMAVLLLQLFIRQFKSLQLESTLHSKAVHVVKIYENQIIQVRSRYQVKKEVQIIRQLKHSHISNLIKIFENDELIFLIMEELKGDCLQSILENQQQMNENQIKQIMKLLFDCCKYLHQNNIFHRDVKPQNIKFRYLDNNLELCLIDFSLTDYWNKNGRYLFTRCGSVGYVAPEVLQDKNTFQIQMFIVQESYISQLLKIILLKTQIIIKKF